MNVRFEGIVGIDQLLSLSVTGMAAGVLLEHVSFFAVNFCKLRLEIVNLKFELLQLVLQLVS